MRPICTLQNRNLTKIGVIKVVITQDLSIQFEKLSDPGKPKAEADLIQHLTMPNWDPLLST